MMMMMYKLKQPTCNTALKKQVLPKLPRDRGCSDEENIGIFETITRSDIDNIYKFENLRFKFQQHETTQGSHITSPSF